MTQHILPSDTADDQRAMRQLFAVIGCFAVATAIMAVTIGLVLG